MLTAAHTNTVDYVACNTWAESCFYALRGLTLMCIACCRLTSLSNVVFHVPNQAAADPATMVLALQGVGRLLAGVQAARIAAAAAPSAACESAIGPSLELAALRFRLYQCSALKDWLAHPCVWQAIGQLQGINSLTF
jgi:hypothetical protein